MILGQGGAGKSELAWAIARRTRLPVTHMDVLFYRQEWTPRPPAEALGDLANVVAGQRWIIDGNFLRHARVDGRFDRADTVVFLDLPRRTCIYRVLKRLIRDYGRRRPDLPAGCSESFDPQGLRWIWRYPTRDRPKVLKILDNLDRQRATIHHLRSRSELRRFIQTL